VPGGFSNGRAGSSAPPWPDRKGTERKSALEDRCYRNEELAELLALPAGHPRLAHAEECPACRALLRSYAKFLETGVEASEKEREDARKRLGRLLDEEIEAGAAASRRTPIRRPAHVIAAAAALVAATLLIVPLFRSEEGEPPVTGVLREERAGRALRGEVRLLEEGAIHVSWKPHGQADSYSVVLYGPDLKELLRVDTGGRTELLVDPAGLPPEAGSRTLLYRILAFRERDEIARSDLRVLREE